MPLLAQVVDATTNPALGMLIFVLGGLAGATFYLPFRKVRGWAWESYWLIYAVCGLIVVPWVLALTTSPNVVSVLKAAPGKELVYCFLCGAMWGLGGLTWGLMIRYLGVGLGLALGCGLASAAGTLVPPVLAGEFTQKLLQTSAGQVSLGGVLVSLIGILLVGGAGMSKENELAEEAKKSAVADYNFKLGLCVAVFAGLMTAALNVGLQGGENLEKLAQTIEPVTSNTWKGIPVLVVVFLGGFAVNAGWCLFLNARNRTTGDYANPATPLAANFIFAGLAGTLWCSQLICVKTGAPAMGTMGIPQELVDRLIKVGGTFGHEFCPQHSSHTIIEPEKMKLVAQEMCLEAGAKLLLHTSVVQVSAAKDRIEAIIVESKSGRSALEGRIFVDCTGDGDVAARCGVPFEKGRAADGLMQPSTLLFRVGNVDIDAMMAEVLRDPKKYQLRKFPPRDYRPEDYHRKGRRFMFGGFDGPPGNHQGPLGLGHRHRTVGRDRAGRGPRRNDHTIRGLNHAMAIDHIPGQRLDGHNRQRGGSLLRPRLSRRIFSD